MELSLGSAIVLNNGTNSVNTQTLSQREATYDCKLAGDKRIRVAYQATYSAMAEPNKSVPNSYPTTQWTQILEVIQKGDGDSAKTALSEFCKQYQPAIYNFFRNHGKCDHEQAQEFSQDFFLSKILLDWDGQKGFLHRVERRGNTKFRGFLTSVLRGFLIDEWRGHSAKKRGGGVAHVSVDDLELPLADDDIAYTQFGRKLDAELAIEIIKRATAHIPHSEYLEAHLRGKISQKEAAVKLGLSENAFRQAHSRFRKRLAISLRDEVARMVGPDEDEIRAEIRYLMSLFAESSP